MRDFAYDFYHSPAWRRCSRLYARSVHGMCEKCEASGDPARQGTHGDVCHHKVHLTPDNIDDPKVTLSWSNLEYLCRVCHAEEHPEIYPERQRRRTSFDADGNLIPMEASHGRR